MRIKFLVDYAGRETNMQQFYKGDTERFGVEQALELIRLGVAEEVKPRKEYKYGKNSQ
jgi:hypothetical protein